MFENDNYAVIDYLSYTGTISVRYIGPNLPKTIECMLEEISDLVPTHSLLLTQNRPQANGK
jgi:hypothetical protein